MRGHAIQEEEGVEDGDGVVEGAVFQGDGAESQRSTSAKDPFVEANRPRMPDDEASADNDSFDLDCIRALEEAELYYSKTRLANWASEAFAGSSQ